MMCVTFRPSPPRSSHLRTRDQRTVRPQPVPGHAKPRSAFFEFGAKLPEVVDLPVEDDQPAPVGGHHGLMACRRKIEDRQLAVGQRYPGAGVHPNTQVVRTPDDGAPLPWRQRCWLTPPPPFLPQNQQTLQSHTPQPTFLSHSHREPLTDTQDTAMSGRLPNRPP